MAWIHGVINSLLSYIIMFFCWIINNLYYLITMLADINIFDNKTFMDMKDKVFALIGLFMLFKLAFSIIQYVINPDKLTDSTSGAQKILIKVVISLAMLTLVDTVFIKAMEFQSLVLSDGVLNKIIFGSAESSMTPTGANTELEKDDKNEITVPKFLSFTLTAPFIDFNDEAFANELGDDDTCEDSPFLQVIGSISDPNDIKPGVCYDAFSNEASAIIDNFEKKLERYDVARAFLLVAKLKKNGELIFNLNFFTPLFLIIFIVVLVIIAVRVAVRAVKLSFLRLIAPLPIISYIDPSDKEGLFKKWWKLTLKTYLELFIQLASFFFAVALLSNVIGQSQITGYSSQTYTWQQHPLLFIFLTIGVFMFAMQLPKLISDLTGANTDGVAKGMKTGANILGSAAIAGVGGYVGGVASRWNRVGNLFKDKNATGKQRAMAIAGAALGTFGISTDTIGAQIRGGMNGYKGGNVFSNAGRAITAGSAARNAGWVRDSNGHWGRIPVLSTAAAKFGEMAGLKNRTIGEGNLKADVKTQEQAVRTAQERLNTQMSQRQAVMQARENARSKIYENASRLANGSGFGQLGGSYDLGSNDIRFNFDGKDYSLSKMDFSEMQSVMNDISRRNSLGQASQTEQNYLNYYNSHSLSSSSSDFDNWKASIINSLNGSTFQNEVSSLQQWNARLSDVDSAINTAQADLRNSEKQLKTAKDNLEKVQKVNSGK